LRFIEKLIPSTLLFVYGNYLMLYVSLPMAGGLAGGILYDKVNPQFPFLLIPTLAVLSILIMYFYVREPKPEEREL